MAFIDENARRTRIRRIALLAVIVLVLALAGGGLYFFNQGSANAETAERLALSKQAFENQDYEQVIDLLENREARTNTIPTIQQDPEALYRYVQARREVVLDGGEHIALLFPALRQVVMLDPGNLEAGELLLQLQLLFNRENDALTTSTRLIEVHPDTPSLLQYRGAIYERLGRNEEALKDIWAVLRLDPLNVRAAADASRLTRITGKESQPFVSFAENLLEQSPNDPRALLITAQAMQLSGDEQAMQEYVLRAAAEEPTNSDFAELMVQWLERVGRFERAVEYLNAQAPAGTGSRLAEEVLYRDYELGNDQKVMDRYLSSENTIDSSNSDLIAVTALSAHRAGDDALANRLKTKLSKGDRYAKAWVAVLNALWQDSPNPETIVAAADSALGLKEGSPYLTYIMGQALINLNEDEAAIESLENTAAVRTSWAEPRYILGDIALRFGEPSQAARLAEAAIQRNTKPEYRDLHAAARTYATDVRSPEALAASVLELEAVLSEYPDASRSLLALYDAYTRAEQPAQAAEVLDRVIKLKPPASEDLLISLSRRASEPFPELAEALRVRAESVYGPNAQIALDRAVALANQGKLEAGLDLLKNEMPEDAGLSWQIVQAQYLSYILAPEAAAAWIALADENPQDLQIQTLAVQQINLTRNPVFAERAIKRMREIGGERSIAWRIARVRVMLGEEEKLSEQELAKAGEMIDQVLESAPNRADAQRLKSRVAELQGDYNTAITAMQRAVDAEANNILSRYRLGQLQHQQRRYGSAAPNLLRVARAEATSDDMRVDAMLLLARQDVTEPILPIAETMVANGMGGVRAKILLVELYQVMNRPQDARELADNLMQNPTPESISFLAEFFQRTNQNQLAERAIAMLETIEMPQSERNAAMAIYAARQNDRDAAIRLFRAAAEAEPEDPARWRTLISMELLFAKPQEAITDANKAVAAGINDPGIALVLENQELIKTLIVDIRFSRLAASLINDKDHQNAGLAALKAILKAARSGTAIRIIANDIQERALANPNYLPLQITAIQLLMQAQNFRKASEMALDTMSRFPSDIDSARLAAICLMNENDYRRATTAAMVWGERAPEFRPYADTIIASAQRQLGRPEDALRVLKPYLNSAVQDLDGNFDMLSEYAMSLGEIGQLDEAWSLVQTRLPESAAWRQLASSVAANNAPTEDEADKWFDAIATYIPPDNVNETLVLTQSILQAADRLESSRLLDRALSSVEPLLARDSVPFQAFFVRAFIAETRGRYDVAEQNYRQLLRLDPDNAQAKNNLAMVLLRRNRNTEEAVRLAQAASQTQPGEPNFLDTLAQAHLAAGDLDAAMASINRAIDMDRENASWYLTKADIHQALGENNAAKILRDRYSPRPTPERNP